MTVGTQVSFRENERTTALGTISRVWDNGAYVTIISDGRTFVRDVRNVHIAEGVPDPVVSDRLLQRWANHLLAAES